MSEIIKQINVDGVDYDIVSESAEKKIAELEKNNTALASITIGTRDDLGNPIKVGLGEQPDDFYISRDIFIGKSVSLSAAGGVIIGTGSDCPLEMKWNRWDNSFTITGGYGFNTIKIGSDTITYDGVVVGGSGGSSSNSNLNLAGDGTISIYNDGVRFGTTGASDNDMALIGPGVQISMYDQETININHIPMGFLLKISTSTIECNGKNLLEGAGSGGSYVQSHNGTTLHLGTGDHSIVAKSSGIDLIIGTATYIANDVNIGSQVAIGNYSPYYYENPQIQIGTELGADEFLGIRGPVYLEAKTEETSLTIGTDGVGRLKIDWGEEDKIVFTNLMSGKKATLTLS